MPKAKVAKRKDGLYRKDIFTGQYRPDGRPIRKSIYGKTLAELERNITHFKRDLEGGFLNVDDEITLQAWGEQWFEAYHGSDEVKTREMYRTALNTHIYPAFKGIRLRDVKKSHLQAFLNKLTDKKDAEGNPCYTKRTPSIVRMTLKQLFAQAYADGLLRFDPSTSLKLKQKVSKPREQKRALTAFETSAILGLMVSPPDDQMTAELIAFIATLYYTGMRPEEARALTRQDVHSNEISIDKAVVFDKDKPVLKGCKTQSSVRTVPIPEPLESLLSDYLQQVDYLVFPSPSDRSRHLNKREYTRLYREAEALMNLLSGARGNLTVVEGFTPYILRHNYATMMAEAGIPPQHLKELMGHSSIEITMRYYVHVSDAQRDKDLLKIRSWREINENLCGKNAVNGLPTVV